MRFTLLSVSLFFLFGLMSASSADANGEFNFEENRQPSISILDGTPALFGEFPALGVVRDADCCLLCSGTLIAPSYVLTVANCLLFNVDQTAVSSFSMVFNTLTVCGGNGSITRNVKKAIVHENFNYTSLEHDIALIVLSSPITTITPTLLPTDPTALTTTKPTTTVLPTTTQPTPTQPTPTQPTPTQPTPTQPTPTQPTPTQPTPTQPTTRQPTTTKPTTAKTTTAKTTTAKPTTAKPSTAKPTTAKTTTAKTTTAKTTTAKPTTAKPTTGKPTTVKPTTKKPTTTKSVTKKPTKKAVKTLGSKAFSTYAGREAVVAGWGWTSLLGDMATVLMKTNVTVQNNSVCSSQHQQSYFVPDNQLCATKPGGLDACVRDIGGPLYVDGVEVGIVSRGTCGDPNSAMIYTRVTPYLDWIANTMANNPV